MFLELYAPREFNDNVMYGFKSMEEVLKAKTSVENLAKCLELNVSVSFCIVETISNIELYELNVLTNVVIQKLLPFGKDDSEVYGLNVLARKATNHYSKYSKHPNYATTIDIDNRTLSIALKLDGYTRYDDDDDEEEY